MELGFFRDGFKLGACRHKCGSRPTDCTPDYVAHCLAWKLGPALEEGSRLGKTQPVKFEKIGTVTVRKNCQSVRPVT